MLAYAIDNPAPATIILISGDRDFAYAFSILRLRQYQVVLVAPSNAHTSLTSRASVCMEWASEVHDSTAAERPIQGRSSHERQSPLSLNLAHMEAAHTQASLDTQPPMFHLAQKTAEIFPNIFVKVIKRRTCDSAHNLISHLSLITRVQDVESKISYRCQLTPLFDLFKLP